MANEKKKLGIDESMDVVNFADTIVSKLQESKDDDGEISSFELAQDVIGSVPAGVKAWVGKASVDDELKDLDADEAKVLLAASMEVVKKIVHLFQPEVPAKA